MLMCQAHNTTAITCLLQPKLRLNNRQNSPTTAFVSEGKLDSQFFIGLPHLMWFK